MDIEQNRRDTADNIYQNYDFGYSVSDATGWYTDGLKDQLTKMIFFEDPDVSDAPTIKGVLTINFAPESGYPIDATCNVNGEIVGNIMGGELGDYAVENELSVRP